LVSATQTARAYARYPCVHGGFTVFPTAVLRSYAVLQWAGLLLIVDHWAAGGVARVADKQHALDAVKKFEAAYGAKFGKAVAKITDDLDELLAFYDYPAEHWAHLRTTNPIESTFATVRLRQRVTKGPGSRAAGVAMAFKLIESAQARWRAVNAPHLVALVRAGARFENGKLVERPDESGGDQQAA